MFFERVAKQEATLDTWVLAGNILPKPRAPLRAHPILPKRAKSGTGPRVPRLVCHLLVVFVRLRGALRQARATQLLLSGSRGRVMAQLPPLLGFADIEKAQSRNQNWYKNGRPRTMLQELRRQPQLFMAGIIPYSPSSTLVLIVAQVAWRPADLVPSF